MPNDNDDVDSRRWSRERNHLSLSFSAGGEIKLITVIHAPSRDAFDRWIVAARSNNGVCFPLISRSISYFSFASDTGQRTGKLPVRSYHDPSAAARSANLNDNPLPRLILHGRDAGDTNQPLPARFSLPLDVVVGISMNDDRVPCSRIRCRAITILGVEGVSR